MASSDLEWIQAGATVAAVIVALGIAVVDLIKERVRERKERLRPIEALIALNEAIVVELSSAINYVSSQLSDESVRPYIQAYDNAKLEAMRGELTQFRMMDLNSAECISVATNIRMQIASANQRAQQCMLWARADSNLPKQLDLLKRQIREIEDGIQLLRTIVSSKNKPRGVIPHHVETAVTLTIGALFGWATNHVYYLKAANDAKVSAAEAERVNNLLLRGIESIGTIEYARDPQGKVSGVNIRLSAGAVSQTKATADLHSATPPDAK